MVLLLLSELATNAVRHADTAFEVTLSWLDPDRVCVHVRDESDAMPGMGAAEPLGIGGRGLYMVASMADGWGVTALDLGKDVWFQASVAALPYGV